MKASDILVAGRALIDTPEKWCKDASARNKFDMSVDSRSEAACKFCSLGAMDRAASDLKWDDSMTVSPSSAWHTAEHFLSKAIYNRKHYHMGIASFNDTGTYETVIAVWDEAIQLAKDAGQ